MGDSLAMKDALMMQDVAVEIVPMFGTMNRL
jgi:hypothetical protein